MHNALALSSTFHLLWNTLRIRLLAWRAHRQRLRAQRDTQAALDALDADALRDIGLRSSETSSVAAEAAGLAPLTRRGVQCGSKAPSTCSTCRARVAGSAHGTWCSA